MIWLQKLTLKRLRRLTLQRHQHEQRSYEARTLIDADTAEAMKRKTEMKIACLQTRLETAGFSKTYISDYIEGSQDVCAARDNAVRARRQPI